MKALVLGKKEMNFDGNDGKRVHIGQIFVSHKFPLATDGVETSGECCSQFNIPPEYLSDINAGDSLLLDLDKKGKILEIEKL